jgi:hypothetical protein
MEERARQLHQAIEAMEERARQVERDRDEQLTVQHLQHQHVVAMDERVHNVERDRDALLNSKWWRLTAPLRSVSTFLKRIRH